jgi:hypothetical protein
LYLHNLKYIFCYMHSIFNCIAFILFISVCFETDLFVSVVSIWIRNTEITETNQKNNLLVSRNKPKNNRNKLSFGLFRFEPKFYFVCFEDTLDGAPAPQHNCIALCTVYCIAYSRAVKTCELPPLYKHFTHLKLSHLF